MPLLSTLNLARRRAGVLSAMVGIQLIIGVGPALAHVELAASNPSNASQIDAPPEVIRLEFSAASEPAGDGLILYDQTGAVAETTVIVESETVMLIAPIDPLEAGQYLVSWTMRAGDAHPRSGSVAFSVAPVPVATAPSASAPSIAAADPSPDTSPPAVFESLLQEPSTAVADWIGRAARMVSIIAVMLGLGAFIFAAVVFEGSRSEARIVGYWGRRAGAVIMLAVPLEIVSQAMLLGGGSLLSAVNPQLIAQALEGPFGLAMLLRAAGGAALFLGTRLVTSSHEPVATEPTLEPSRSHGPTGGVSTILRLPVERFQVTASPIAISGAVAVALSFLFDGHTAVTAPSLLVQFASVVHVVAAATWVGGVAMLTALFSSRRSRGEPLDAARLVIPFSTLAAAAVVMVGLAGGVLALAIVDSVSEFFTTAWGRTLLLKLAMVATAGAIGAYNHQMLVPLLKLPDDHETAGDEISKTIRVELAILLSVAVVTAVLVALAS